MRGTPRILNDGLSHFIERHPRLFVLTGAGCSTDSGIPDYRDSAGEWKRRPPIRYQEFVGNEHARNATGRGAWRASAGCGWRARTTPTTRWRRLERRGRIVQLVTQNVDGLHHAAGSENVIDLHGRIDTVRCLGCGQRTSRDELQRELERRNPSFAALDAVEAPDGDADLLALKVEDRCSDALRLLTS